MKKFLLLLSTLLMMNVVQAAQSTIYLAQNDSLKVNCPDSTPILDGNIVRCEVGCQVELVQVFQPIQYCDQSCWTENKLVQTEVSVMSADNQTLSKVLVTAGNSVEAATLTAKKNVANSCKAFQVNTRSTFLPVIYN